MKFHARILRMLMLLAVPLGAAWAGAGCRPDFAPYNRLVDLRVLAIQSEPAAPATGETATLKALVYTPPGFAEPSYSWRWCPFPGPANGGHKCLITEPEIAALIASRFPDVAGQVPAFDLGTAPEATLPNTIDPLVLEALCKGTMESPPVANCDNGFPFQVALTVSSTNASGDDTHVDAVVTGHWRFNDTTAPNLNPAIDRLTAAPPALGMGAPEEITEAPSDAATPLPRDVATPLTAVVSPAAAEVYRGPNDDGVLTDLRERLFLTWFVETGGTDDSRTSFTPPQPPDMAEEERRFADLQKNTWAPGLEKDYPRSTARLYVVIHDNRGGVNWKMGTVNLETAQ